MKTRQSSPPSAATARGYFKWLDDKGIDRSAVHVVEEEATACAHIITDLADNQITAFNPGA